MQNKEFNPKKYWETRLAINSGLTGVGFTMLGDHFNKWAYKTRKFAFLQTVNKLGISLDTLMVADIGSGTGFYIDIWKRLGVERIQGFDLTDVAVQGLRKKFPELDFTQLDISAELPEELNNKFDVVSCMDVLFHIVDDAAYLQAFKNINKMLKPGGVFVFSENFVTTHKKIISAWFVMKTKEEGLSILRESNFKIISRRPLFFIMSSPTNSDNLFLKYYWKTHLFLLPKLPVLGTVIGFFAYPFEVLLLKYSKTAVSTEIFSVQKPL